MIQKSQQILSTVQQIKLRCLQLEVEALWEQVQDRSEPETKSLVLSGSIPQEKKST